MTKNKYRYDLSVVIITRNEEEMIAKCIESVLSAIDLAKSSGVITTAEVILSDSASTDKTIDIAMRYPIKIIQLESSWELSAAAGLYIGFLNAQGKIIQNLGGDQIMDRNWLSNAIPYVDKENVGAVCGFEAEYLGNSPVMEELKRSVESTQNAEPGETDMAGVAIFNSSILAKIGRHNPYLKGGEDRDLSYRITEAGYRILKLPHTSNTHYWAGESGELNLSTQLSSAYKWGKGDGQAARYHIKNKIIILKYLTRYFNTAAIRVYGSLFLILMMINANILALFTDIVYLKYTTILIDIPLIGLGSSYIFIKYKAKKLYEITSPVRVILDLMVRHFGFIRGFLTMMKNPSTYPTNVKIIKTN